MRLVSAAIYPLDIPFVESFRHSAAERSRSDSVVVRVRDEVGTEGYGEGAPRRYVTGETVEAMVEHLAGSLWPEVAGRELPDLPTEEIPGAIDSLIPEKSSPGARSDHASRAALEVAIVDCWLRRRRLAMAHLFPPRRRRVVYSGVITAGSVERAVRHARQMRLVGLREIKVKVGLDDDMARIRAIRETVGPDASLRLDANGAWNVDEALRVIETVAPFGIASIEEPLRPGPVSDLKGLREASPIPIMADESLVSLADADALIREHAVDLFNIRISKCGGLYRSREIARRAAQAGIGVQVGSQVGETAILSAAGRHLAAALEKVVFVEGSYGTLLLTEDVSAESVRFGHRGEAPILTGPGLGIRVVENRLREYARAAVELVA